MEFTSIQEVEFSTSPDSSDAYTPGFTLLTMPYAMPTETHLLRIYYDYHVDTTPGPQHDFGFSIE